MLNNNNLTQKEAKNMVHTSNEIITIGNENFLKISGRVYNLRYIKSVDFSRNPLTEKIDCVWFNIDVGSNNKVRFSRIENIDFILNFFKMEPRIINNTVITEEQLNDFLQSLDTMLRLYNLEHDFFENGITHYISNNKLSLFVKMKHSKNGDKVDTSIDLNRLKECTEEVKHNIMDEIIKDFETVFYDSV